MVDFTYTTEQPLPVDVTPITDSVVPTTATAYHKGDLLIIAAGTNVATHSDSSTGAQADWHVICLEFMIGYMKYKIIFSISPIFGRDK